MNEDTFAKLTKYKCHHGEHKPSNHRKSLAPKTHRRRTWVDMDRFNRNCNNKRVTVNVDCSTESDYRISSMDINEAKFECTSKTERKSRDRGPRGRFGQDHWYYVWWTCKQQLGDRKQLPVRDMKTCTLMPNAVTKTFRAKPRSLPYRRNKNNILRKETTVKALHYILSKLAKRTAIVAKHGLFCNQVETGGAGVRVGRHFLQIGSWRLRSDGFHLWVDTPHRVAFIFRGDQRVFRGGRRSRWDRRARTKVLTSVNMDIPKS